MSLFTLVNCSDGISDVLTSSNEAVLIVDKPEFCCKLAGRSILKKTKKYYFIHNNKFYPWVIKVDPPTDSVFVYAVTLSTDWLIRSSTINSWMSSN